MINNMSTTIPGPLPASTVTTTNTGTGTYTINPSATLNTGYTITSTDLSPAMSVAQSGRLELSGGAADIVINGVSLTDSLKAIEQRLNILRVNDKLEAEWDQLKDLGEQYRRLEAELLEKQRMWEIMKK